MRLAAASLLALSACSYLMVPTFRPEAPLPCERSKVFAHIDQTYAVAHGVTAALYGIAAAAGPDRGDPLAAIAPTVALTSTLIAIAFRASARRGYREVARCRAWAEQRSPGYR